MVEVWCAAHWCGAPLGPMPAPPHRRTSHVARRTHHPPIRHAITWEVTPRADQAPSPRARRPALGPRPGRPHSAQVAPAGPGRRSRDRAAGRGRAGTGRTRPGGGGRPRPLPAVPPGDRAHPAALGRRRGGAGPARGGRCVRRGEARRGLRGRGARPGPAAAGGARGTGQGAAHRGQSAARRLGRQAVHGTRPDHARPGAGGQPRADPRGGEVRLHPGLQVLHLRDLVDTPGDVPRPRRPGPHHPGAGARGGADQPGRAHPARPAPGGGA